MLSSDVNNSTNSMLTPTGNFSNDDYPCYHMPLFYTFCMTLCLQPFALHFSKLLYNLYFLTGDVGGYMGLLCGMSIITIGEFIDFVVYLLFQRFKKK